MNEEIRRSKVPRRKVAHPVTALLVISAALASGVAMAQTAPGATGGLLHDYAQVGAKLGQAPGPYALNIVLAYTELSGSSDVTNLAPTLGFQKFWDNGWGLVAEGSAMHSTSSGATVAENFNLDVALVRSLSKSFRAVLVNEWHRDVFKGLKNRNMLAAALLWKAVEQKKWSMMIHGGPAWHHEEFTNIPLMPPMNPIPPDENHFVGIMELSNNFTLSPTAMASLTLTYYEDFDESDNYRFDGDVSLQAQINSWLSFSLSYELKYDNRPAVRTTDTAFVAGVNITLRGKGKPTSGSAKTPPASGSSG